MEKTDTDRLYKYALIAAIFTVIYNLAEGFISIWFGLSDDALTLFGFGVDSFIETISALGICYMLFRSWKKPESERSRFEVVALKITGWCFYFLALTLLVSAIINVVEGKQPDSTLPGIIISSISIISMIFLIIIKKRLGKKLNSPALIADANCNLVCVYMSIVLLVSSGLYAFFEINYIDLAGALGILIFAVKEGRESFQKAKGISCSCETDAQESCCESNN